MNFLQRYSKTYQTFLYKLFSIRRDRQREGERYYESNFTISVSHYKCVAHLQKSCEISGLLTGSRTDITLLYLRLTQLYTRFHWLTHVLWDRKVPISNTTLKIVQILFGIARQHFPTRDYIFLPDTIYYKLQNAQWSDQYSVHKINPDIHLMCELHETVKLFTTACSLTDADSHFLPNQRNSCSCNLFNVCSTAQDYIDTNVRISKEKWIMIFKEN